MAEIFLTPTEIRRIVSRHIPALDGLRGIAILLVLVCHIVWMPIALKGFPGRVIDLAGAGWVGVELFFVLSGFLITGILVDSKTAENYLSSFYLRRALRILPLYYGTVFVAFILLPLLGRSGVPYLPRHLNPDQIWYWFYAGNWAWLWHHSYRYFGLYWSLAVEEQFYFVWPWVVLMTSRHTLGKVCFLLLISAPILRAYLFIRGTPAEFIYPTTWSYVDTLALGALAALIVRDERWIQFFLPYVKSVFWLGLLGFILIGFINRNFDAFGATFIFGVLPISISFLALLLWALATTSSSSLIQNVLNMEWLRTYGKYSYAIYIFHGMLIPFYYNDVMVPLVGKFYGSPLHARFHRHRAFGLAFIGTLFALNLLVDCLIMLGVGKLSWWAFEGPINRLKDRFKVRWKNPIALKPRLDSDLPPENSANVM